MFFGVGRPFLDPLGGLGLFGGGTIGVLGVDEGLDILLFYCTSFSAYCTLLYVVTLGYVFF
jgi:hypothetical protein